MSSQLVSESKSLVHARTLLVNKWPAVQHSDFLHDLTYEKGEVAFLSVTCNSLSYHIKPTAKARAIGLPFNVNQPTGYFKLLITSDLGHGELIAVSSKCYCMGTKKKRQHSHKAPQQLTL